MPLVSNQLELRGRRLVESLDGTWSRSRGMCRCPAHPDRTPSLSVTIGRRAILFHCFAGCTNAAVIRGLATVEIGPSELFNGSGASIELEPRREEAGRHILRLWKDADILAGARVALS